MVIVLTIIGGCGNKEDANAVKKNKYKTNREFSMESMLTIKGVAISLDEEQEKYDTHKQNGYAYRIPDVLLDVDGVYPYEWDEYGYEVDYIPEAAMEKYDSFVEGEYDEEMEDQILDEVFAAALPLYGLFRYDDLTDKTAMDSDFNDFKAAFKEVEEIGIIDSNTYYFGCNREYDKQGLRDGDIDKLEVLMASFQDIRDSVCLFPPVSEEDDFKVDLTSFSCVDLDGNPVDQSIFADYDVTMINCWTTWCGYCIEEMPDLAELSGKLPSNFNVITICFDAAEQADLAKSLLAQAGATGIMTLVANDELNEKVGSYLMGFPTTFFVDKTGKVVGSLEIGAPTGNSSLSEAYLELIKKAYEEIE